MGACCLMRAGAGTGPVSAGCSGWRGGENQSPKGRARGDGGVLGMLRAPLEGSSMAHILITSPASGVRARWMLNCVQELRAGVGFN